MKNEMNENKALSQTSVSGSVTDDNARNYAKKNIDKIYSKRKIAV